MPETTVEDARAWLQNHTSWAEADERIRTEARMLRVDPTSDTAVKHAVATYEAETGRKLPRFMHPHHPHWEPPVEQEEMF